MGQEDLTATATAQPDESVAHDIHDDSPWLFYMGTDSETNDGTSSYSSLWVTSIFDRRKRMRVEGPYDVDLDTWDGHTFAWEPPSDEAWAITDGPTPGPDEFAESPCPGAWETPGVGSDPFPGVSAYQNTLDVFPPEPEYEKFSFEVEAFKHGGIEDDGIMYITMVWKVTVVP
jgi:hypothetical protein